MMNERTVLEERDGYMGLPRQAMFRKFRTVRKFLWEPMVIAGEQRWLCRARWREELLDGEWVPVYWVEE